VGGARVEHARARFVREARGFSRGLVGQTQDGEVGLRGRPAARGGVLSLRLGQLDHLQVAPAGQPLANAKAGGTDVAIDEDAGRHRAEV